MPASTGRALHANPTGGSGIASPVFHASRWSRVQQELLRRRKPDSAHHRPHGHSAIAFGVATLQASVVWAAPLAPFKKTLVDAGLWHTIQRKLLAGTVDQKLQREHDLLALSGSERYRKFCLEHPDLSRQIPVGQLASYLGLTSVSLSRIRSSSKKRPDFAPQRTA